MAISTIYQVVTNEGMDTEKRLNFNTYAKALTEAEKIEHTQEVHIHQVDDGEIVGCLWDNEITPSDTI